MGEIADMMLDGDLCEGCGEYMGGGSGYARRCYSCRASEKRNSRRSKVSEDESDESAMWKQYREKKREQKIWHQQNTVPKDKELLATLPNIVSVKEESDGAAGERFVIMVNTNYGTKTVDWWTATGKWKVRKGKGEGVGIYKMARYFQLIPRKEPNGTAD